MSLKQELAKLEDRFYGELEEDRTEIVAALSEMHKADLEKTGDSYSDFAKEVQDCCGGVFIPYIFWVEFAAFLKDNERRGNLFEIINNFCNSGFEEIEVKKMKPLLITYFAEEREFELDKLQTQVIDKAHPSVQEHFRKWMNFVEKNKTSRDMYSEKFQLLRDYYPDFNLLATPVTKLKEKLAVS